MSIPDFYHSICKTKINTLLVFHFQVNLIFWQTQYLPTKMKTIMYRNITGLPMTIKRQVSLYSIFQATSIETIMTQPLLIIYEIISYYLDYCQEKEKILPTIFTQIIPCLSNGSYGQPMMIKPTLQVKSSTHRFQHYK